MPGSRAPGCASIDAASSAEARRRVAAERRRIERDDQLPGAGRRALRHRDRTTPRRRSSRRSVRPPAVRPSAPARCPWRRPSAAWCRAAPRPDRWSACRRHRAPSLRGCVSPRCFAVMMLPRATFDSDRSITSGARPGSGQANATGLVPNTGLRSAPRRHRARRVDEHQRDQALAPPAARPDGRPRRNGSNGGSPPRRCPGCARPRGSAASASSIAGKAKPLAGVDRDQAGPRPRRRAASREPSILPHLGLRRIHRHARQAVALEPVHLGRDQRAGDAARIVDVGAAARQRRAPPALPPEPASASASAARARVRRCGRAWSSRTRGGRAPPPR